MLCLSSAVASMLQETRNLSTNPHPPPLSLSLDLDLVLWSRVLLVI